MGRGRNLGSTRGCKNFFYAFGLFRFPGRFRIHGTRKITLTGYEIDACRVYTDLRSAPTTLADTPRSCRDPVRCRDFLDAPGPARTSSRPSSFVTKTPPPRLGSRRSIIFAMAFFAHALKISRQGTKRHS